MTEKCRDCNRKAATRAGRCHRCRNTAWLKNYRERAARGAAEVGVGPEELRTAFAKRLRQARLAKGWSQLTLGARAGLASHTVLGTWEAERNLPSVPLLIQVAKALGVSVDYLLGTDDEPAMEAVDIAIHRREILWGLAKARQEIERVEKRLGR